MSLLILVKPLMILVLLLSSFSGLIQYGNCRLLKHNFDDHHDIDEKIEWTTKERVVLDVLALGAKLSASPPSRSNPPTFIPSPGKR